MRALCLSLFLSVSLSLFSQITVTVENTPLRAALRIQAFLVVFSMKTTKKAPRSLGELSDPF